MPRWTDEARKRQSVLIRVWSPWKQSTGPKSAEGKRRAAMNAYKGGKRKQELAIAKELKALKSLMDGIFAHVNGRHEI